MNPIKKWNQLGLFTRIMVGFVLGIAAGTYFWRESNKAGISWNYIDRLLTMVVVTIGAGTFDMFG